MPSRAADRALDARFLDGLLNVPRAGARDGALLKPDELLGERSMMVLRGGDPSLSRWRFRRYRAAVARRQAASINPVGQAICLKKLKLLHREKVQFGPVFG